MTQQQTRQPQRTDGIRSFLNAVDEQLRAVEAGRLVMFGTRRHGFTREERLVEGQQNQTQEVHRGGSVEHEG